MILTFGGGKREKESERRDSVNGAREREREKKTESRDSCDAEGYTEVSIEAECLDKAS